MNEHDRTLAAHFRRHFHKARAAHQNLPDDDQLNLRLEIRNNKVSGGPTGRTTPAVVRFVSLTRPFLNPNDRLYYEKVVDDCRRLSGPSLTEEAVNQIKNGVKSLKRGAIPFTVNGKLMDAEEIYTMVADGGYFQEDEGLQRELQSLRRMPVVDPLLWFVFYSYCCNAFLLVSALFDAMREAGAFSKTTQSNLLNEGPCIFCLTEDGHFTAEEHIFPESLGNQDLILRPGVVCDACNNGQLAILDNALLQFEPIAFLQVMFVPFTKKGQLPSSNFQNLSMARTAPRHIQITSKDRTGEPSELEHLEDGSVRFKLNFRGRRFDSRPIGRALYKIGLELLVLEEGSDTARSSRFDNARKFVIGDKGIDNNLIIGNAGTPHPSVRAIRYPSLPGTGYLIDIFGVTFMINLENTPVLEVNEDLANHGFVAHSLAPISVA